MGVEQIGSYQHLQPATSEVAHGETTAGAPGGDHNPEAAHGSLGGTVLTATGGATNISASAESLKGSVLPVDVYESAQGTSGVTSSAADEGTESAPTGGPFDNLDPEFKEAVRKRVVEKIEKLVENTEPIILEEVGLRPVRVRYKEGDDWKSRMIYYTEDKVRVEYDPKAKLARIAGTTEIHRVRETADGRLMIVTKEVKAGDQVAAMLTEKVNPDAPRAVGARNFEEIVFESILEVQQEGKSPTGTTSVGAATSSFGVSPGVKDPFTPEGKEPESHPGLTITFGDDGTIINQATGEVVPYEGATRDDVFGHLGTIEDNIEELANELGVGGIYEAVENFVENLVDVGERGLTNLREGAGTAWDAFADAASNFWDGVSKAWEGAKQFASDLWDGAKDLANTVFGGGDDSKSIQEQRDDFDNSDDRRDNLAKEGIDPGVRDDDFDGDENTGPGGIL